MNELPVTQGSAATRPPGARMMLTLSLIAMLSGLVVVLVYRGTAPIIAENQRIATERAVFQVVPGAVSRRDFILTADGAFPADSERAASEGVEGETVYAAYDADGRLLGIALKGAAQGYQDVIKLLFGYDPACQCVRGIKVLKLTETPGLGDKIITDPAFVANFDALDARAGDTGLLNPIVAVKHGSKQSPWEVDAISGATISSAAVAKALNHSLQRNAALLQRHLASFEEGGR
jgi:electron transport complex protein RnfG